MCTCVLCLDLAEGGGGQKLCCDSACLLSKWLYWSGELIQYLSLFCRYVIDKKGVVQKIYNSQFDPESHIPAALEAL